MRIRGTIIAIPVALIAALSPINVIAQEVKLIGSGASFPFPIYSAWFKDFSKQNKGVTVDYQAKGSGAGIQDFTNKTVDFAASALTQTDGTGQRSSLARMALADLVQTKGLGLAFCSAR